MLKKLFTMRFGILLLCCAALVGGLGCFSLKTPQVLRKYRQDSKPTVISKFDFDDAVFASAKLSPSLETKLFCTNGIAFLGKRHTYILTTGGKQLLYDSLLLDGSKIELETSGGMLLHRDHLFWGNVRILYLAPPGKNPATSESDLLELGFKKISAARYESTVYVEGVMQEPVKLPDEAMSRFAITRRIEFHEPAKDHHIPERLSVVVKLPVALIRDTVLLTGLATAYVIALPFAGVLTLLGE